MKSIIFRAANFIFRRQARSALFTIPLAFVMAGVTTGFAAVTGNIDPLAIEIDQSANLFPSSSAVVDWVKDSNPNTDTPSLIDSIAVGIIPNVTGAQGGRGHWYGVRIVDGIAGNDQDIFLTGGKENDLSTWNVGPGTVGSSKYDITQAYLANNNQKLFFGMERRGNNGTTAFDFEFNRLPPNPATPLVPTRSVGDVLFSFEMNGSGSSGSAVPHYFRWNGTAYVEQVPAPPSLISSINNSDIPAAPWGYVNSKGDWTTGTLLRFTFAEASVNLSEAFPGLDLCNGAKTFVQVRTRSSVSDTSDLKDTTKIFGFNFGGPEAVATLAANCAAQFTYSSTGSTDSSGGSNLTYSWDFKAPAGVTLSGTGLTGPDPSGAYHSTSGSGTIQVTHPSGVNTATVTARLTVVQGSASSCTASTDTSVDVLRPLQAVPGATTGCLAQFSFDGSGSSGGPGFVYTWDFVPPSGVTLGGSGVTGPDANGAYHATTTSGTVNVTLPAGINSASISVKLTLNLGDCTNSATTNITVLRPVVSSLQLGLNCLPQFTFANSGSTAGSGVTYSWDFIPPVGVALSGTGITGPDANGTYHATSASGAVDVSLPAGVNSASVFARLTTTRGVCTATAEGSTTVLRALTAAITQKVANGTNSSVALTGAAVTATSLQWQRLAGDGTWVNLSGATGSSVVYSSFEADSTPTVQSFNIDGTTYQGKLYQVQLRLHAERSVGGILCTADSTPVTLKKVIAVDP